MRLAGRGTSRQTSAATLGTLVLACGMLAACGSSAQGGGSNLSADKLASAAASVKQAAAAPQKISATQPLSKAPPKGKRVFYLKGATSASEETYQGIREAADAVGWSADSVSFDESNISTFNAGLLRALSLGANYVIESGIGGDQLSKSTVDKFSAAGVPIIIGDPFPVPETDTLLGDSGGRNARVLGGDRLADWFVVDSQGKGSAVVANVTTYPSLTLFTDQFSKHVKETCPACRTKTIQATIAGAADGSMLTAVIAALRSDRSIKYAAFDFSGFTNGLDAKLAAAGLGDVKVIGYGIDPTTAKSIRSGQSKAFIGFNYKYMGWSGMDIAVRHSVGDRPLDPKAEIPSQLFTSANIDQLGPDALFRAPADSLEQFKKLWLVTGAS